MKATDAIEALKTGKASPQVVANAIVDEAGEPRAEGEAPSLADDVNPDLSKPGNALYAAFIKGEITKDQYAAVVAGIKESKGGGKPPAGPAKG